MPRWLLGALLAAGCATAAPEARFAALEHLCVHCNCLMPAGTEPDALCAACNCGKRAHQCVRGE